jgi:hypothetical protein
MSLFDNNQEFVFKFDDQPVQKYHIPIEFTLISQQYESDLQNNIINFKVDHDDSMTCKNSCNQESTFELKYSSTEDISNNATSDEITPITLNFVDGEPQISELELIIAQKVAKRGYNDLVLDCLDLDDEDDFDIGNCDLIRKKQNKTKSQIRGLKAELKKRPNWTKRSMKKVAKDLGLTANQVYKWHWDQTNKSKRS